MMLNNPNMRMVEPLALKNKTTQSKRCSFVFFAIPTPEARLGMHDCSEGQTWWFGFLYSRSADRSACVTSTSLLIGFSKGRPWEKRGKGSLGAIGPPARLIDRSNFGYAEDGPTGLFRNSSWEGRQSLYQMLMSSSGLYYNPSKE